MTWSFQQYFADKNNGLYGKLRLSESEQLGLLKLRKTVRVRIKKVFDEATNIAKEFSHGTTTTSSIDMRLASGVFEYLEVHERQKVASLIFDLDAEARDEFIRISPRFLTQGSFKYNTLNRPYSPSQEMDIDDGAYLPMPIFDNEPKAGHALLLLLVSTSLKSLVRENLGWVYDEKQTCARIKIPSQDTHIDVPMYAIPEDKFITKELVTESASAGLEKRADAQDSVCFEVDTEKVNLALRTGPKRWANSDPKVVEDWFEEACKRNGKNLRKYCRFFKAWRDTQWEVGGPSSISLMAAIVNILDSNPHDGKDLCKTMKLIAIHLERQFEKGVESPDESDEKPLFPGKNKHDEYHRAILGKLRELPATLESASKASTKDEALGRVNVAFGDRVVMSSLILPATAAPAFAEEPSVADSSPQISATFTSG